MIDLCGFCRKTSEPKNGPEPRQGNGLPVIHAVFPPPVQFFLICDPYPATLEHDPLLIQPLAADDPQHRGVGTAQKTGDGLHAFQYRRFLLLLAHVSVACLAYQRVAPGWGWDGCFVAFGNEKVFRRHSCLPQLLTRPARRSVACAILSSPQAQQHR